MKPILVGLLVAGGVAAIVVAAASRRTAPENPEPVPSGDVRLYLYTDLRMTGPELVVSFAGEDGEPTPWVSPLSAIGRLNGRQGARIRLLARRVIDPAPVDRFATQLSMLGHNVEVDFKTPVPYVMPQGEADG